jgi:uncharacterized metal-binding protein YceD (DUF177 family)
MKLSEFDIDFNKFKNEKDSFTFKLKDAFFELKENSLYQHGDFDVEIQCEKFEDTIVLDYSLVGHIKSQCERCLNQIKIHINTSRQDVLKLTLDNNLLNEENYLSVNHPVHSVYDSIYEQICLDIPTRLICENSEIQKKCTIEHLDSNETDKEVDERWAELKKLIN